jgi:hypothetical protein
MQLGRPWRGVTLVTASMVALVAVGNAYADTKRISDGNDRPGPLDIRSASHGHDGDRVVHTISTFSRWRPGLVGRNTSNLLAVEISRDGDPALEYVVLVFSKNGRMVGRIIRLPRGLVTGFAKVSRPNARTVRVSIPLSELGDPGAYRWDAHSQFQAAGACSDFCIDRAPNSGLVLHDVKAPTITLTSFPAVPPDVEYDVSFRVSDAGPFGLRRWQLQHRPFGTPTWTTVASGRREGLKTHHYVSAEDNGDQFRVIAVDRGGNATVSPIRLVSVPVDDDALTYTGTWTTGGTPSDFRGTLHSSTAALGTAPATYNFSGQYVAWVAPGGGLGTANVYIDGQYMASVDLGAFTGRRQVVFEQTLASPGPHTIVVDPVIFGYTVSVDGIIVR